MLFYIQCKEIDDHKNESQLTFTFKKSTIETLKKGVKYVQSQQ